MISLENNGQGKLNLRFGVSLAPGVTDVPEDAWEKCKSDPITKHYLSTLQVRVVSGSAMPAATPQTRSGPAKTAEPDTPPEADFDLADMKAKEAVEFVKHCADVKLLEVALLYESRTTVLKALNKRLDELVGEND